MFGRGVPPLSCDPSRAVRAVGLGGSEPLAVWRESRLAPALRSQGIHVLWSPVAAIPLRTAVPRVATIHELPWRVRPEGENQDGSSQSPSGRQYPTALQQAGMTISRESLTHVSDRSAIKCYSQREVETSC